jgi:hypothetical protein
LLHCTGFAVDFVAHAFNDGAGDDLYSRLRGPVNYVTLIPALLFFISLGRQDDLSGRFGTPGLASVAYSPQPPFCSAIHPTTSEPTASPSSARWDSFSFASWRAVLLRALLLRLPISV